MLFAFILILTAVTSIGLLLLKSKLNFSNKKTINPQNLETVQ